MEADRQAVCTRVLGWRPLVPLGWDPMLILGLVAQESRGDPWAWRYEPGFWSRRKAGILADVVRTGHQAWLPHGRLTPEDYDAACDRRAAVLAASYGLCQVLLSTALELGAEISSPMALCDPPKNLALGCQQLRRCFVATEGAEAPIRAALLAYNGGGAPAYPDLVLGWRDDLMEARQHVH